MLTPQQLRSFQDELQKLSWFGKYYHGTSPSNEPSILREGLKASYGGGDRGAIQALTKQVGADIPVFRDAAKGAIHVTPSKTVARVYGGLQHPEVADNLKSSVNALKAHRVRESARSFRAAVRGLANYHPLEIQGKGLSLVRDPFEPAGLLHKGDIAASRVSKTAPSRLGNLLRKAL